MKILPALAFTPRYLWCQFVIGHRRICIARNGFLAQSCIRDAGIDVKGASIRANKRRRAPLGIKAAIVHANSLACSKEGAGCQPRTAANCEQTT